MMRFQQISDFQTVHTPGLRERAQHSSRSIYNHHYIAQDGDIEFAFVSIDLWPGNQPFVLYELVVAREHRNKGIGSHILQLIEKMAIEKGYSDIVLTPKPIDNDCGNRTQSQIEQWYEKRGYHRSSEFANRFEKHLL